MLLRCPVIAVQLGAQQLSGLIAADDWRAGYATVSLALPFVRAGDDDHVDVQATLRPELPPTACRQPSDICIHFSDRANVDIRPKFVDRFRTRLSRRR